jgi:hypothetical protein
MNYTKITKISLALNLVLKSLSPATATAKEYEPVKSPELYEKANLQPLAVSFSQGVFVSAKAAVGGTLTFSETSGNPGIFHKEGLDVGYRMLFANWNFLEVTIKGFKGELQTSKSKISHNYAAGLDFSYGYLLVDKLHGVFSLGATFINSDFDGEIKQEKLKSTESFWSPGLHLDYLINFRLSRDVHFSAGLGWGWNFFSLKDLKNKDTDGKSSQKNILQKFHTPRVNLGLSYFI